MESCMDTLRVMVPLVQDKLSHHHTTDSELELETRVHGLTRSDFDLLLQSIYKDARFVKVSRDWQVTVDFFWQLDHVRGTSDAKNDLTFIRKTSVKVIDIIPQTTYPHSFQIRVSLNKEESIPKRNPNWGVPQWVRCKQRFSFLYNHEFRYDFTISCQGQTKEQAVKNPLQYEFEIEYLGNKTKQHPIEIAAKLLHKTIAHGTTLPLPLGALLFQHRIKQ